MASFFSAALTLLAGTPVAAGARFESGGVLLRSSGFSLASESVGHISWTPPVIDDGRNAKGKGKAASLLSVADETKLLSSANAGMFKRELFQLSSKIGELVIHIQDLTNPLEMGFKSELKLTASDLDDLDAKMAHPLSKLEKTI